MEFLNFVIRSAWLAGEGWALDKSNHCFLKPSLKNLQNNYIQLIFLNFLLDNNTPCFFRALHIMTSTTWMFALRRLFSTCLTIFKTALVSIILILELSVLDKCCLELNFQAKQVISRVPCTAVFLRLHTSNFQYLIF